ncbi:MAG: DUF1893 domain-containing protein [Dehalococcoidales bacterium]|nr:DUF1893 domain-containing protein [Dehalococcoidales bacterium]
MLDKIDGCYHQFLPGRDTLRIYSGETLIFSSRKERLQPLLEFIDMKAHTDIPLIVFDRVIGNAAALLLTKIPCREVFSPLGSEMAKVTLEAAGIIYHFDETVDCIKDDSGEKMCPMEQLSQGKNADEFIGALKNRAVDRTKKH